MTPDEIKAKIKDIVTNHIRAAEDPAAADQVKVDLHDVLTAKMRDRILGRPAEEQEPADVQEEPENEEDEVEVPLKDDETTD